MRKFFLHFLCLSFFLGGSLVFGAPGEVDISSGEPSFAVSPEGKRFSQRLFIKMQKKQACGGSKISKKDLSGRSPLSFLNGERNILGGMLSVQNAVTLKKKRVVSEEKVSTVVVITVPNSASKLSEGVNIEELFLNEIEIAGGWEQLLEKLIEFAERELNEQNSITP